MKRLTRIALSVDDNLYNLFLQYLKAKEDLIDALKAEEIIAQTEDPTPKEVG